MSDPIPRLNAALEGRYRVEREVGEGGMATVYLADDLRHERKVALKVLKPELAAVVGAERFLAEIKTTANLQHPHILPLFDSGEADGFLFYVMPWVQGETLRERLDRHRQLGVDDATALMTKVASALDYAHDRGVVHRDIKPSNILLSEQGEPLVADFGIALALDVAGDARITHTGFMVGTPAYSSPEQAAAEPHIDGRSDQYSLACVAFEMLAGEPPYTGPSAQAITSKRLTTPIPSVRTVRDALAPDVDDALKRALATVPQDRFDTVTDFAEALGRRDSARATFDARRRSPTAALAGGALLIGALAAGWLLTRPAGAERANVVIAPFENLTGDPTLDAAGRAASEWLSQSLTQTSIAEAVLPATALPAPGGGGFITPGAATTSIAQAASASGFGTIITGSYYLRGDSIEFQAQITDAADGRLITGAGPVRGPVDEPLGTVAQLADQLFGSLGAYLDPLLVPESWAVAVRPPNYRAWQAHVRGRDHVLANDYREAIAAALEAIEIDPTFGRAYLLSAGALISLDDWERLDTLVDRWEQHLSDMLPLDRSNFSMVRHTTLGDLASAVGSGRESARLAPDAGPHLHAIWLTSVSPTPAVAVELFESRDPEMPIWRSTDQEQAWMSDALHRLGSFERELNVGREGLSEHPGSLALHVAELRALAALGRVEEVLQGVELLPTLVAHGQYPPNTMWTPGVAMSRLARELSAHGSVTEGRFVAEQAVAWYAGRPNRDGEHIEDRIAHTEALILNGGWQKARDLLRGFTMERGRDAALAGLGGVVAAGSGDPEEAHRMDSLLGEADLPYDFGEASYWRARIATELGDLDGAVSLLRSAFAQGSFRRLHVHVDFPPEITARVTDAGGA